MVPQHVEARTLQSGIHGLLIREREHRAQASHALDDGARTRLDDLGSREACGQAQISRRMV
eukprot:189644-Pyramimonas_sp.AAC.1